MEKYWIESGNEEMKAKAEASKKARLEAKELQEKLKLDNEIALYWASKEKKDATTNESSKETEVGTESTSEAATTTTSASAA